MLVSKKRKACALAKVTLLTTVGVGVIFSHGCNKLSSSQSASLTEQVENEEREFARAVLLKVTTDTDRPSYDLAELLKRGEVQALPPTSEFNTSESLYSSINSAQKYSVGSQQSETGALTRLESFVFREGISPGQLKFKDQTLPLQVSLSANAEIKVVRTFKSSAESLSVPPYSLVNLPLNEANARKMRIGDLFVIPLEAQFMTSVDGAFLRSAAQAGAPLLNLLGSSMRAHGGSGLRANLLVSGRLEMHIFKTAQNLVRVRFFEQNSRSVSGGGSASASAALKYTVLPLSKLHTVGELKKLTRIRFYGSQELQLSDILKGNFKKNVLTEQRPDKTPPEPELRDDGLVDVANRVSLSAEKIQQLTTDRLNGLMGKINDGVIKKINEPIEKVKKYSDQEFAVSMAASWDAKKSEQVQFFSEYEFDLGQALGIEAYLHAVSGASLLLSASSKILKLQGRNGGGHNLVIAERIAGDTIEMKEPPVRRLLSASARSTLQAKNASINFGEIARFAISESWKRETYKATVRDSEAFEQQSELVRWTYNQGYKFGIVSDQQVRTSGYVSNQRGDFSSSSLFWYTRTFDWRGWSGGNLNSFLNTAFNVLGHVAESLNLSKLYKGEVAGPLRGRITLAITDKALQRIFDSARTQPQHVWDAVARVAQSFDNTFGLPFVMFPMGLPAGTAGTAAQQNCELITRIWGSFYCHFLAREFIPALQEAQAQRSRAQRVRFFESFLSRGFGANKVGSDLFARVLLELLLVSGDQLSPADLAVKIEALQASTADSDYNPKVIYGNPETLEFLGVF